MSPRLALLNLALRRLVKPRLARLEDPLVARREFAQFARLLLRPPRGARIGSDPVTGGLRADPPGPGGAGAVLWFHGGGFIAGAPETHRGLIARLAAAAGVPVHAPRYRLAPEHPLPAAADDARAAWAALRASGLGPERIVLGGDSAGGGLALALLSALCRAGTPPAGLLALSPWTDLTGSGPSIRANAAADPMLPSERFGDLAEIALGGHPAADPAVSPLFAEFPGCPPVLLIASETEILLDDSRRLVRRLQAEGAPAGLRTWPDTPHAWPLFGRLAESGAALAEAGRFVAAALSRSA